MGDAFGPLWRPLDRAEFHRLGASRACRYRNGRGVKLVLSLFPGIGLLDMAFEDVGFCVVRGPDPLWGGDVRRFHVPPGRFDGIIGGPPCQPFSQLVHMVRANGYEPKHENLIPEYERIVAEAQPSWFLMEEVRAAPLPEVAGYSVHSQMVNARHVGSTQNRERRISFGTQEGRKLHLETECFEPIDWDFAVTGDARTRPVAMLAGGKPKGNESGGRTSSLNRGGGSLPFETMCELQGLPHDFLCEAPFTVSGKRQAVGNGVPLPLGRAIARAILTSLAERQEAA
jgi:DNA (cytosine-5)-methyltransferase 1